MRVKNYRLFELFLLFVLIPISFAFDYPLLIKAILAVSGFVYILWILKKAEDISFKIAEGLDWKIFWKRTLITFLLIAIVTTSSVFRVAPENFLYVPLKKPGLFVGILLVYTVLSVWPQEIIYRTFFMNRYDGLFRSKKLFIFVNAILFSLAHLFFRNTLVVILTFLGGLIFAYSYLKFKSTTLVCIEHAIYGNWLFTVGMGEMLGFPGMEP